MDSSELLNDLNSRKPPEPAKSPCLIVKAVLLVLSMLFAIFGLFFFSWHLHFRAVSSCQTLAVVCALYMHQVYSAIRGKLLEIYNFRRFKAIFILCVVVGLIQLLASISYGILGMVNQQRFSFDYGFYVSAIPSSMACLWAFLLAYECKCHMNKVIAEDIPHFVQ